MLFEIDAVSAALSGELAEKYHSRVTKLLYSTRYSDCCGVPEYQSAGTDPTDQDWQKWVRVLKCINES